MRSKDILMLTFFIVLILLWLALVGVLTYVVSYVWVINWKHRIITTIIGVPLILFVIIAPFIFVEVEKREEE